MLACRPRTDVVLVGSYLSLSGVDSTFGVDTKAGIDMAVDEINARGGIGGVPVKMRYEDDKSTASETANKVRQLIDRDKVLADPRRGRVEPVARRRSHREHAPRADDLAVVDGRRGHKHQDSYVFRTCFTNAQQGDVAARFIHDTLGKKRVALFYVAQDNYSSGLAATFRQRLAKLGGTVVLEKSYAKGETNFTTFLEAFKAADPDVIFVPNYYNDMGCRSRGRPAHARASRLALRRRRRLGLRRAPRGGGRGARGGVFHELVRPRRAVAERAGVSRGVSRALQAGPEQHVGAGVRRVARALRRDRASQDRARPEAIKDAIAETKDFAGATGQITIGPDHNANKPVVIVAIRDKNFTFHAQMLSD